MGIIAKCRFSQQDTNLYYYPDVEEIHVGFEYQSCHSLSYDNNFSEREIVEYKIPGGYKDDIADLIAMMDDGYGEVRVPLLTKEQIEKEGWIIQRTTEYRYVFEYNNYLLDWNPLTTFMRIEPKPKKLLSGFTGDIPTINHLRQIMKLLNIK